MKSGSVLLAQPTAGTVVAFSSVCPHEQCAVGVKPTMFECPCHHSTFELATGARISGPATRGLDKKSVTVVGGNVVEA